MNNPHPSYAVTRCIPHSFLDATVESPPAVPIDIGLARKQHQAYVEALLSFGLTVIQLPADHSHPDCCFVEDCALCVEGVALIANLGAPARRGEELAVAEALRPFLRVERMGEPATLDGGDCLRVGKRIFVGRSKRTNEAGIARVKEVFGPLGYEIIPVPVPGFLHLKCCCSSLGDDAVLLARGTLPPETFGRLPVVLVPREEAYAANCVVVRNKALLPGGFLEAAHAIRAAGLDVIPLDTSEIRKADGSLTCLSILF